MRIYLLTIILLTISYTKIFANENDIFTVKNIKVDKIATTAEEARTEAIEYAQKYAFKEIVQKLLNIENTENNIPFEKISHLVQTIELKNEVITNRQYKAIIHIDFHPEQSRFLINNYYLNKNNKKISFLLIPIFNENGMIKLWQSGNLWYNLWLKSKSSNIIDIKIPLGDIDDMMNFKINELNNLTSDQAQKLAKLYKVDKILITELDYNYQEISPDILFQAKLKLLGDSENINIVAKSKGFKEDNYNKHLNYLVKEVITSLESGWASYNNQNDNNWQEFIIKTRNIHDWLAIKDKISSLDLVKSFKINAYSLRYAKIMIEFNQSLYDIINDLKYAGFKISRNNGNVILQTNVNFEKKSNL